MKKWNTLRAGLFALTLLFFCFAGQYFVYHNESQKASSQEVVRVVSGAVMENQKKQTEKKIAYLTFDDGPSENTERVLEVLKAYEVPATFFLIGSNITEDKEPIVKRIEKEGHTIGIHTYSHEANEMYQSAEAFQEDFSKAERCIRSVVSQKIRLYRFPWGSANSYLKNIESDVLPWLEQRGYVYCDWNVSGEDSVGTPSCYSIYHNVEKDFGRFQSAVILLHDSGCNKKTAEILPDIIAMIKKEGYAFDTLDHMDPPYQYPKN